MRHMLPAALLCLLVLAATSAPGQLLTVHVAVFQDTSSTDGIASGYADTLVFGIRPDATICLDAGLEEELPPSPPSGIFDARFTDEYADAPCMGQGSRANFQNWQAVNEFGFKLSNGDGNARSIRLGWNRAELAPGFTLLVSNDLGIIADMQVEDSVVFTRTQYLNKYLYFRAEDLIGVDPSRESTPEAFALHPVFPNPFNPSTTVAYDVPRSELVTVAVYSMTGERVAVIVDRVESPGTRAVSFDGSGLSSGVYLCRMTAGSFSNTRKLLLIR